MKSHKMSQTNNTTKMKSHKYHIPSQESQSNNIPYNLFMILLFLILKTRSTFSSSSIFRLLVLIPNITSLLDEPMRCAVDEENVFPMKCFQKVSWTACYYVKPCLTRIWDLLLLREIKEFYYDCPLKIIGTANCWVYDMLCFSILFYNIII